MPTYFDVRLPSGILGPCSISREQAEREIAWYRASGIVGNFRVEAVVKQDFRRRGSKWPAAKLAEFRQRYSKGERVQDLVDYFDTNYVTACRKGRECGLPKRIDDTRNFEKHRGRWTEREHQLINLMYDEGIGTTKIPTHHPRTKSAVEEALRATAWRLSTRSKFGRFIVKGRRGRKSSIHRVLEEAGEPDSDGD